MDSPLIRVNPLELNTVELVKNSGNIQSGLAGVVQFTRSQPLDGLSIKSNISQTFGALNSTDFALSGDFSSHRISLRYAEGTPFEDAEKNSYVDSYGYKENYKFKLAEVLFRGNISNFNYGMSFTYTDNISFPYLRMDERLNWVYSAFARYKNHKLYFNYTHHIMDNGLRINPMFMETDAKNLTIGAIGDFYEAVYRNWKADNFFESPSVYITDDLIPDVSSFMLNFFKSFDYSKFRLHSKLGISYQSVGEKDRELFYQNVHKDAEINRFFPTFSLGVSYLTALNDNIGTGLMIELNSEAPETESLFIAVKKPGTKPAWSGNPTLNQPLKASLRGSLNFNILTFELYEPMFGITLT